MVKSCDWVGEYQKPHPNTQKFVFCMLHVRGVAAPAGYSERRLLSL